MWCVKSNGGLATAPKIGQHYTSFLLSIQCFVSGKNPEYSFEKVRYRYLRVATSQRFSISAVLHLPKSAETCLVPIQRNILF